MVVMILILYICLILPLVNGISPCHVDASLKKHWTDGSTNIIFTDDGFTNDFIKEQGEKMEKFQCIKEEAGFRVFKSVKSYTDFITFDQISLYTCIKVIDNNQPYLQMASFGENKNAIRWTRYATEPDICQICRLQSADAEAVLSLTDAASNLPPHSKMAMDCNMPESCTATNSFDKPCQNNIGVNSIDVNSVDANSVDANGIDNIVVSLGEEIQNMDETNDNAANEELNSFCKRLLDILNEGPNKIENDDKVDDDEEGENYLSAIVRFLETRHRGNKKGKGKSGGKGKPKCDERKDCGERKGSDERKGKRKGKCNKKLANAIRAACETQENTDG